jgi:hypothetical protein
MQTKSNILLIKEAIAVKESAKTSLNNLMDKYTIEDSVFSFRNGMMYECTEGYFEVIGEYNTINEAVKHANINSQAIRVINNTTFQVGNIHTILSECAVDNKVFDLNRLESVR